MSPEHLAGSGAILVTLLTVRLRAPMPPPKLSGYAQITGDGGIKTSLVTDGPRIYFSGLASLYQVSGAGGEAVPIPVPFPNPVVMDVSPSRSELLVGSFAELGEEMPLWVVPVPGGSLHRFGNVLGHSGAWSPDARQIVYSKGHELYVTKIDGTEPRKLATLTGIPFNPRWSPEGSRLRFHVQTTKANSVELWEAEADGSKAHPLLPGWSHPPAGCCGNWTPDGRYFLFHSSRNRSTNIWAVREKAGFLQKASADPVQLTLGPMNFSQPVPSTDGRKIFVAGGQRRGELARPVSQLEGPPTNRCLWSLAWPHTGRLPSAAARHWQSGHLRPRLGGPVTAPPISTLKIYSYPELRPVANTLRFLQAGKTATAETAAGWQGHAPRSGC
jgi:hypothetical protein